MKIKHILIYLLCLSLTACLNQQATPFVNATITPAPSVHFTARLVLSATNGDIVKVYSESVQQDFTGKGKPDMNFIGVNCAVIPSGGNVCHDEDTNLLISTLSIEIIESGCWNATKVGNDYTLPTPCSKDNS